MNGNRLVIALMLAIATSGAFASQGVNYGGPVGGTDIGNAYLPPQPGFYGVAVAGYAGGNKFYGDNGKQNSAANVELNSGVAVAGLLYVYPVTLFGGTLATSVSGSYAVGHTSQNGANQNYRGFGDLYSDLLQWSKHIGSSPTGFTVKVAYSMIFPVGKFNTTDVYTVGRNTYLYIPNVAVTYLTGPNFLGDGLELSVHAFVDIAGENTAQHYQTGTVVDIDWAVSEVIGKWQVGVAGYYARQIEDDHQNGMVVGPTGNRFGAAGIGPVVSYNIPQWKANVKLKVLLPIYTKNSLAPTQAFVVFSKAFN